MASLRAGRLRYRVSITGREGETVIFPRGVQSGSGIHPMTYTTFVTQDRTEPLAVLGHPSDKLGWRQGKAVVNDVTF